MEWILEISQDYIISKTVLKEEPIYLASGKLSKRTKIPFMDIWKKYKDGLKQCGFGLYKSSDPLFLSISFSPISFSPNGEKGGEKEDKKMDKKMGEKELWIVYFRTRKLINNSKMEESENENENNNHIILRNKYYEFFCKTN